MKILLPTAVMITLLFGLYCFYVAMYRYRQYKQTGFIMLKKAALWHSVIGVSCSITSLYAISTLQ